MSQPHNITIEFVEAIATKFPQRDAGFGNLHNVFTIEGGRKYDRIIRDKSVYAFIDLNTFELVKPASYKTPAKLSNGETAKKYFLDTSENFQTALFNADPHGSFLYKDYEVQPLPHG
jgi:hypothetical protein